jgi:hypothetical protein
MRIKRTFLFRPAIALALLLLSQAIVVCQTPSGEPQTVIPDTIESNSMKERRRAKRVSTDLTISRAKSFSPGYRPFIYLWLIRIHSNPFAGSWHNPEGGKRDHSCKRNL